MREQILKSELLNNLMKKSSGSTLPAHIETSSRTPSRLRPIMEICGAPKLDFLTVVMKNCMNFTVAKILVRLCLFALVGGFVWPNAAHAATHTITSVSVAAQSGSVTYGT